jgi:hypothetical protein
MPIRAGVAPEAKIQGRGDGAGSEESAVAEPSACRSLTGLSGGGFFFFASDPVFRRKISLQDRLYRAGFVRGFWCHLIGKARGQKPGRWGLNAKRVNPCETPDVNIGHVQNIQNFPYARPQ